MRFTFILVTLFCPLIVRAQTPPDKDAKKPPEKGHIAGQVVNEVTGEPLRKATITVYAMEGQSRESLTGATDAAGKYHIDDLEPGKYNVNAARNGFVQRTFGAKSSSGPGTLLSVGPGGTAEANFKLTPHSVVTGRIVDEDGEAMANVQVHLSHFSWSKGKRTLFPSESAATNDLGEYRIFGIGPGKYYLSASYNPQQWNQSRVAGDSPDSGYPPLYYPGTADPHSASQIEVPKSGHLGGIDLTMQIIRTYRLKGKVMSNIPGQSKASRVMVMLQPKSENQSDSWVMNNMKQTDGEGKFEFDSVVPGTYEITANAFSQDGTGRARQEVTVAQEHVNGVSLTLNPGWEMKGTLRMEGDAPNVALNQINLLLETDDPGAISYVPVPHATIKDDGSFTFKDIGTDRYRIRSWNLPDGSYIKAAHVGSTDVLDRAVDFSPLQGAAMEVVLSPKGGVAEGSVKNDKDELVTNGTVVLVPEATKRSNHSLFKQATPDQYGHYKITGIPPGSYSLYAFQGVESGIWEDPDYLKTIEKQATDVALAESGHESNDLKVIVGDEN